MTIIASTGNSITGAVGQGTLDFLITWLAFMRGSPGWTIPRSSDGTSGGAGDFIGVAGDLSQFSAGISVSWFVLRSPDGGREYLFYRVTADDRRWDVNVSPNALYIGGDAGNIPTAVGEQLAWQGDIISDGANFTAHFTADNAAPYGWAIYCHAAGAPSTKRGGFGHIPITAAQPSELDPFVQYFSAANDSWQSGTFGMGSESATFSVSRVTGFVPGDLVSFNVLPANEITSAGSSVMFPDGCQLNSDGADVSFPIPFGRRSGASAPNGFKGFSAFCRWNGAARAPLETFNNRARISFGDVNFPWDGVTNPIP